MQPAETPPKKTRTRKAKQDAPLTQEELEAQVQELSERAKADGLSLLKTLLKSYAQRGLAVLDSLDDSVKTKTPKRKA